MNKIEIECEVGQVQDAKRDEKHWPKCEYVTLHKITENHSFGLSEHRPDCGTPLLILPFGTTKVGDKFKITVEKIDS